MPTAAPERLETIAAKLLEAAGAPAAEAAIVARHSIGANLAGHDSHGIIQIPSYIKRIEVGHIVPGAPIEIERESATTTVVDGAWGFGYVVSEHAMKLTIEKAAKNGIAATTVRRQGHIGRVADYPIMAAEAGMIAMMTADSGRSPKHVAPFGAREARLGTNPICFAMPSNLDGPFHLDMATSAAAAGKLQLAKARGTSIPEGWVLDAEGRVTTDPNAFGNGGVLMPLGGGEGYKGYGLSAMVEIFSGILPGLGFGIEPSGRHNDGCFIMAVQVEAFRPLKEFKAEITEFAAYLKSAAPAEGFDEVFYPGEIEHLKTARNQENGIAIEDKTWETLADLARKDGLAGELGFE